MSCSVGACPDAFSLPWCVLFALPTCVGPPDACLPCSFGVLLLLICCVSCRLLRRHYHFVASLFVALVFFVFVVCLCHLFCRPFRPFRIVQCFLFCCSFRPFCVAQYFLFCCARFVIFVPPFAACCAPFVAPIVGACCASLCLCALWLSCPVVGGCFP